MGQIEELEKIQELKNKGVLTEYEFETEKNRILKGNNNVKTKTNKKTLIIILISILVILLIGAFAIANLLTTKEITTVQVPNLVGMTLDEVKKELKGTGLTYEVIEEQYSDTVEEGKVISQSPQYYKNYTITNTTTIMLILSLGEE